MGCDMCGKEAALKKTSVEGTTMQLCATCQSYGVVERQKRKKTVAARAEEMIIPDYAQRIKTARESKELKQEQLAQKIGIKLSQLHKFESGNHEPDIATAKKLEQALNIKLVTKEEFEATTSTTKSGPMTIGDLLR